MGHPSLELFSSPPPCLAMPLPAPVPCVPDRPYKVLLVQVGTLSFSRAGFKPFKPQAPQGRLGVP